jgi:hypothetical protein
MTLEGRGAVATGQGPRPGAGRGAGARLGRLISPEPGSWAMSQASVRLWKARGSEMW